MQKNATPTKEQAEVLKNNGIVHTHEWTIVQDLHKIMIIKHRYSGEFRVVDK